MNNIQRGKRMKRLIWIGVVVVACIVGRIALAGAPTVAVDPGKVTAEFTFELQAKAQVVQYDPDAYGDRLITNVRMHNIQAGDCFRYAFKWTSPCASIFTNSVYVVDVPAGECQFPTVQCKCADTQELGCWRSDAYRTVSGDWNNHHWVPRGTWTVELWRVTVHPDATTKDEQAVDQWVEKIGEAYYRLR